MSTAKATAIETLHTCPECGQGGFLAKGLASHQGGKTCKKRALAAAPKPAMMQEFATARRHAANIIEHARRASHESILLGHELNRLKLTMGERRGGNHKAKDQSLHVETLLPWDQLVEQQTGLSYSSCHRSMQLATAAKKHIPVLMSEDVLKNPFNRLPEARQAEVVKALEKAADGRSMSQLMLDFGAWKEKKASTPPPPTKKSAAARVANQQDETLSKETLMKLAKEQAASIQAITLGEAWKTMKTSDLASMENNIDALKAAVAAELTARRGSK